LKAGCCQKAFKEKEEVLTVRVNDDGDAVELEPKTKLARGADIIDWDRVILPPTCEHERKIKAIA
jgi:hypothetical protein